MSNWAIVSEIVLIVVISYVRPLEVVLGTRAVASPHFMIPTFSYYLLDFFRDEVRKMFIRGGTDLSVPGKISYTGWVARNTYW